MMSKAAVLSVLTFLCSIGGARSQTVGCISSLDQLEQLEALRDTNLPFTRVLCPRVTYNVGTLEGADNILKGGQTFIRARPNLTLRCGANGARVNGCVISGGSLHIDATDLLGLNGPATNVRFEGITFENTRGYFLWGSTPGDITFSDCEFRDTDKAAAPIFLDYFDGTATSTALAVTFEESDFINHRYFGPGSYTSIITATSAQNQIIIKQAKFINNDYTFNNTIAGTSSSLIDSSGPVTVEESCFTDNSVGVAPIVVYGSTWNGVENFGQNSVGGVCQFIADFQNQAQFENFRPSCFSYDSFDFCAADGTRAPTTTPSVMPSDMPSMSPTTSMPTSSPTDQPSSGPTSTPTTGAPTITAYPSPAPSVTPTSGSSIVGSMSVAALVAALVSLFWMV